MLNLEEAQKIMNYYGFMSNSIEPTLCETNDSVGIFATFKTKYGHLSRFIKFDSEKEMKKFLDIYLWYRKNLKNEDLIVEFDDYEVLSPIIKFIYKNIELTNKNFSDIQILDNNIEELVVDTTYEDNIKLLQILIDKMKLDLKEITRNEEQLSILIERYKDKLSDYNKLVNNLQKVEVEKINEIDISNYERKIQILKNDINENNFIKKFDELLETYENSLTNNKYLENLYLIYFYNEEIKKLDEKISKYNDYVKMNENSKNKLFKNKKHKITFEQYLKENIVEQQEIDKNSFIESKNIEAENKLIEWKNNSIDDLKKIYGIIKNNFENKEIKKEQINYQNELNNYFMLLSKEERNQALIISSPIKELINIIINLPEDRNRLSTIINEPYFLNKFKDMYLILSNQDNYATTRKYLKSLKLDTLEEFINSIIEFTKNINIKPYVLPINMELKFKIGVLLKKGYINASIKNDYPVNNRGANNYYLSNTKTNLNIYFAPYIIKLDEENNLIALENDSIIFFELNNLNLIKKIESKVNNYMLKKEIISNKIKYNFPLFNQKIYITSVLENGDINE